MKILKIIRKIINKIFYYYLIIKKINNLNNKLNKLFFIVINWGLGIGDWGLGIPNPQSPIPNPQFLLILNNAN